MAEATKSPRRVETAAQLTQNPAEADRTQDLQIAEALIDDIVAWRYEPGLWIREREIAARFDVSHAPVREAFRHVARAGFVTVVPWRGARVVDIDLHSANEVLELWKASFGLVCSFAAEAMKPDQHVEMLRLLQDYERSIEETGDPAVHTPVGFALGRFIAEAAKVPLIDETLRRVGRLALWQHKLLSTEQLDQLRREPSRESARRFRLVCAAIIAGDRERAGYEAKELLSITQAHIAAAVTSRVDDLKSNQAKSARTTTAAKAKLKTG